MKKSSRKLVLRTQTIRALTPQALSGVVGGFIMQDTIIIPPPRNPLVPGATPDRELP